MSWLGFAQYFEPHDGGGWIQDCAGGRLNEDDDLAGLSRHPNAQFRGSTVSFNLLGLDRDSLEIKSMVITI